MRTVVSDIIGPYRRARRFRLAVVIVVVVAVLVGGASAWAVAVRAGSGVGDAAGSEDRWAAQAQSEDEWAMWESWRERAPQEVARVEGAPRGFAVPRPGWVPATHQLLRAIADSPVPDEPWSISLEWMAVREDRGVRSLDDWVRVSYFRSGCRQAYGPGSDGADPDYWEQGRPDVRRLPNGDWVQGRLAKSQDPEGADHVLWGAWEMATCLNGKMFVRAWSDPSVDRDTLERMLGSIPGTAGVGDWQALSGVS